MAGIDGELKAASPAATGLVLSNSLDPEQRLASAPLLRSASATSSSVAGSGTRDSVIGASSSASALELGPGDRRELATLEVTP